MQQFYLHCKYSKQINFCRHNMKVYDDLFAFFVERHDCKNKAAWLILENFN